MSKVSVIIPNYNHAQYLKQRIDSVLNQTYRDFEVILLDDCSTDNSKEIIEGYRDNEKIAHIIYNSKNSGSPFYQWDKGIQLAGGEYVWIAESDDWCEISLLENLVAGLDQNKECVLAYCQGFCVTANGKIEFQSIHNRLTEYIEGRKFLKEYLLLKNPIFNAGMAVWRREVYKNIHKNYLNYKLIGDYCFWIELCNWGWVFINGKMLNYFRKHEKNVSFGSFENGITYTEQLPLLKQLMDSSIIDKKDYLLALKKNYFMFRISETHISKESSAAIKKLFSFYSKAQYRLDLYFQQKRMQQILKRLLRI